MNSTFQELIWTVTTE